MFNISLIFLQFFIKFMTYKIVETLKIEFVIKFLNRDKKRNLLERFFFLGISKSLSGEFCRSQTIDMRENIFIIIIIIKKIVFLHIIEGRFDEFSISLTNFFCSAWGNKSTFVSSEYLSKLYLVENRFWVIILIYQNKHSFLDLSSNVSV